MVNETTAAGDTKYLLNPAGDPIAEVNPGTGSLAGTFYYHPDGLGSIRAVTDANTTIRSTYAYEPFGTPRPSPTNNDTVPNRVRYAGEHTDPNTGLSHMRARDYDPTTGRFTGLDPVAQDINDPYVSQYVYANDRPTFYTDPSGRFVQLIVGALIGAGTDLGIQVISNLLHGCDAFSNIKWGEVAAAGLLGFGTAGLADTIQSLSAAAKLFRASESLTAAAKSVDDGVDLYRHVSPGELADIGKNGFRPGPNSLGGKWFAESGEHASQWGRVLNNGEGSIVKVRVPGSLADQLMRLEKLDGIGPARYVEPHQLDMLNRFGREVW